MSPRIFRLLLFVCGSAAVVFRKFSLFLSPRFWGEEGAFYFKHAYSFAKSPTWFFGLLNVPSGYVDLWPAVSATISANLFALEQAPFATTLAAFAVQILPLAIVMWTRSTLWNTSARKVLVFAIVVFNSSSGEIFLNTTNSQWHFGIASFLTLLASADGGRAQRAASRAWLAIGGLTCLASCLMTPFFWERAIRERAKERFVQAIILTACSAVQVVVMFSAWGEGRPRVFKVFAENATTLISIIWVKSFGLVFAGPKAMSELSGMLSKTAGEGGPLFVLLGLGMAAATGAILVFLGAQMDRTERLFWTGAYFVVILASILGSRPESKGVLALPGVGERYFFVPNIILSLFVLRSLLLATGQGFRKPILAFLLTAAIVSVVLSYRPSVISSPAWPNWKEQCLLRKENPGRAMEIWPPGWSFVLERK